MHVVGTAGHVDHGKSTLVRTLTGIDPDRLREEKEREMTIDLGYAWLTLPGGETVSVIDVPGHEDFIRNMLAGVGGIDAAVLTVAADDGVMPQTREHVAILDLLHIRSGVVALTKTDLVGDQEWLEMVKEDVAGLLLETALAGFQILPVSARTRQGLPDLVNELDRLLQAAPPRPDLGQPRLLVDRVFTVAGFGTVVTGTLIDGRLRVGDEVEIVPRELRARIRGLQTHRKKVETALPGSRVAINLTGVTVEQIARGDVVTRPGWLTPTVLLDASVEIVPGLGRPLRHNDEVQFFCGSAEVSARVRVLNGEEIAPGQTDWVQLRFASPVGAVKGDRFILRQPSPGMTLGGGTVVDPGPRRQHRRLRSEVITRLETLAHGTPEEILLQALRRGEPCPAKDLLARSGLAQGVGEAALTGSLAAGQMIPVTLAAAGVDGSAVIAGNLLLISASGWDAWLEQLTDLLGTYHKRFPLRGGLPREELKSRLRLETRLFNNMLERAARERRVALSETMARLPEHVIHFTPQQQSQLNTLLAAFRRTPCTPPTVQEALTAVGPDVLSALLEQGTLVKVSEDICFLGDTYREMLNRVIGHIKSQGSINVGIARDMFGTTRKYIMPFLEHLDQQRITRRVDDEHVLR